MSQTWHLLCDQCRRHVWIGQTGQATPKWLTGSQKRSIESFYAEAARVSEVTSVPHEVDHIVPLKGKNVCGLNVPWNLRVITQLANRTKRDAMPEKELQVCREATGYRQHPVSV